MKAHISPRQMFAALAIVLAIVLVGLIVYISRGAPKTPSLVVQGGDTVAGIKPLLTIQGPGEGEHPTFNRPLGAAFGPDGRIYVADTGNNRVCVFDSEGKFLFEFGGQGIAKPLPGAKVTWEPGKLNFPTGITVTVKSEIYVADFRNDCVEVFDAAGKFLRRFPDPMLPTGLGGSGQDSRGIAVTDVAVRDDVVYATDEYQVFEFSTAGKLIRQFGMPGRAPGKFERPNGIDLSPDGKTLYVADSNNNRVQALNLDGKPLWTTGSRISDLTKESDNPFALPRGLTVLNDGTIVVVDTFAQALVTLDPQGKVLGSYGERGAEPGQFNFPNSVDSLGKKLVVGDKENNRVVILELVRR